jgi:hypothetical protein
MNKTIAIIILTFSIINAKGQSTIYPGNFRYISAFGPLMNYWADTITQKEFTKTLDSLLIVKRNWTLNKNNNFQFAPLKNNASPTSINNYPLLNINFIEYSTLAYIKQFKLEIADTNFTKEIVSVLRLEVRLENNSQSGLFEKSLDIYVRKGQSIGIGIPINNLNFTKKGMLETLKKSFAILFDSTTTNEAIELRVAGAFIGDDFVLNKTRGLPRIQVSTTKGISKFKYHGEDQLMRWGEQLYREVILKGKNKTIISDNLTNAFDRITSKDDTKPIFLIQEGRDIVANQNYLLQLAANIGADPNGYFPRPIVSIIPGNFQVLMNEKDTLVVFDIQINKIDSSKKILLHQVTNGVDTSSITNMTESTNEVPLMYDFLVSGKINKDHFAIKISGDRYLREFYLNNQLICIANGNLAPERFVMIDDTIPAALLNKLFIIGFNSFFQ